MFVPSIKSFGRSRQRQLLKEIYWTFAMGARTGASTTIVFSDRRGLRDVNQPEWIQLR